MRSDAKKLNTFLIFVFGLSFVAAGLFYGLGQQLNSAVGMAFAVSYMFFPAIASIIVEKFMYHEPIKGKPLINLRPNKWFLLAWLLPPAVAFLAFAVSLLFPSVSFTPDMAGMFARYESILSPEELEEIRVSQAALPISPILMGLFSGLIAGLTVNAIAGLGEEWGWRGFMVRQLQKKSFFYASLFIGLVWGLWHAPIILMGHNYPEHPVVGVLMMTVWCILLSPLFLYVTLKTKSVLAAAIMHGTLNGTAGLAIILVSGGSDLLVGMTGLAGFIALALTIGILYFYDTHISKEQIMRSLIKRHIK